MAHIYGLKEQAPEEFFIANRSIPNKSRNKNNVQKAYELLSKQAEKEGLSKKQITNLARLVLFEKNSSYDISMRKRLLCCLIPENQFPYEIIPLAIQSITTENSQQWKKDVLNWIGSLLEYQIINSSNIYVGLCYTSVFKLAANPIVSKHASKFLYYATQGYHVTSANVKILVSSCMRFGMDHPLANLLRLYCTIRPDLNVFSNRKVLPHPVTSRLMLPSVHSAQARRQNIDLVSVTSSTSEFWPIIPGNEKSNPHARPTAYSQPEVLVYPKTLEERYEARERIQVIGFRRVRDFFKTMEEHAKWSWPNNSASLLQNPAVIPLFLPHKKDIKIQISHWLELALRTIFIEGRVTNENQKVDMLIKLYKLSEVTQENISVIYQFLIDYLLNWNQTSYIPLILNLITQLPYMNASIFYDVVFLNIKGLMSNCTDVNLLLLIIDSLTKMAINWITQHYFTYENIISGDEWLKTWYLEKEKPLKGLHYMIKLFEPLFIQCLQQHNKSIIVHKILSFYILINKTCCLLKLDFLLFIPPLIVLNIVSNQDISAIDRIGHHFSYLRPFVENINRLNAPPESSTIIIQSQIDVYNKGILIYMYSICLAKSFRSDHWHKWFDLLVSKRFYTEVMAIPNQRYFGYPLYNINYLILFLKYIVTGDYSMDDPICRENIRDEIITTLAQDFELSGILTCTGIFS